MPASSRTPAARKSATTTTAPERARQAAPAKATAASAKASPKPSGKPAAKPASKGGPLTAAQRTSLEKDLERERRAAVRSRGHLEETLAEDPAAQGKIGGDVADMSSDFSTRESATLLASRGSQVIREIDEALRRLRQEPETFNVCSGCGERIAFERLETLPTARQCLKCARPSR